MSLSASRLCPSGGFRDQGVIRPKMLVVFSLEVFLDLVVSRLPEVY